LCEAIPVWLNRFPASKKRRYVGGTVCILAARFLQVEENKRAELFPLASSGGIGAEPARIVYPRFDLLAFLSKPVLPAGEIARRERFKIWLQR
jgi:hypothetical protein